MARLKNLFSKRKRWFWVTMYVLYVVFILISATAYYAEQSINTRAANDYVSVLTFPYNGTKDDYKQHFQ